MLHEFQKIDDLCFYNICVFLRRQIPIPRAAESVCYSIIGLETGTAGEYDQCIANMAYLTLKAS